MTYAVHDESLKGHAIDNELFEIIGERFGLRLGAVRACYKAGCAILPVKERVRPKRGDAIAAGAFLEARYKRRTGRTPL